MQHTCRSTISRFGCNTIAKFHFFSPEQDAKGHTQCAAGYASIHQAAGIRFNLLPIPLSTLGGWHPDGHKALCSLANIIAARGLSTFSRARFERKTLQRSGNGIGMRMQSL